MTDAQYDAFFSMAGLLKATGNLDYKVLNEYLDRMITITTGSRTTTEGDERITKETMRSIEYRSFIPSMLQIAKYRKDIADKRSWNRTLIVFFALILAVIGITQNCIVITLGNKPDDINGFCATCLIIAVLMLSYALANLICDGVGNDIVNLHEPEIIRMLETLQSLK